MANDRWISDLSMRGPRGLPGLEAEANAEAVGEYIDANTAARDAVDRRIAAAVADFDEIAELAAELAQSDAGLVHKTDPGAFAVVDSEVILDGEVLDMAMVTPDDHLLLGWGGGQTFVGTLNADEVTAGDGVLGAGDSVPLDLFPTMGQSNSTKRSSLAAQVYTPTPWVMAWDADAEQYVVEDCDPPWLGAGVARAWSDRDARPAGHRAAAIECGVGGSGFSETSQTVDGVYQTCSWDPANGTAAVNLAERARDMILDALAAAPDGSEIKAIPWSQGEADRGMLTGSQYADHLDDLIDWFRTELDLPDLPFIISPFAPLLRVLGNTAQTDEIAAALEDTPRRVEFTAFLLANVDDSEAENYIHWSPDAQHRRGAAMLTDPDPMRPSAWVCALLNKGRTVTVNTTNATNVVTAGAPTFTADDVGSNIVGSGIPAGTRILVFTSTTSITMSANATATASPSVAIGAPPRTPPGLTISRSGNQATITWGHPPARVESFELETCVDGVGSVWSAATLTADTTHRHVMTVTAGTPLWVRITATCLTGDSYTSVEVHG